MEPIWARQDPGGPHVGPMNLAVGAAELGHSVVLTVINKERIISAKPIK